MIRRFFAGVYKWMALIGLIVKDDEPIDVRDPDRQWGPPVDGLQLSAKAKGQRVSVVLKNNGGEIRTNIPGWLFFYRLEIAPPAPLTNFGKQALDPKRNDRRTEMVLPPGKAIETELPVDSLYNLRGVAHRITASCEIGERKLVSNEVTIA
jgi:hypothetical protein